MSKIVNIGGVEIGGGNRIAVQSMSTFKASELNNSIAQATELKKLGCDILRYSVLDDLDASAFSKIKKSVDIPLVADIHFDYKLALKSIDGGADKIRINPGNIGSENNVIEVATALKSNKIPVRVGANTGSIEKEYLSKYGVSEVSLGESALKNVSILEKYGVEDIVVSVKASSVPLAVKAYRYIAQRVNYPLHLGVTEAGTENVGTIKSALALGSLLLDGIGDTIRVSLSADPIKEVIKARQILSSLELTNDMPTVIACPTCGRCMWDCMGFAKKVEDYLENFNVPIKVAVMGCVVNGPGEASNADVGVAGGKDGCVIFSKGKILKSVKQESLEKEFFNEIDKWLK